MRRAALLLTAVLGAAGVTVAPLATPNASAQAPIVSVIIDGTGNGHGRGMSQWGAYGWAVDRGWNWEQILDHYYGRTTMGDADTNGTIDVQLKALDAATTVGVVSYVGAGNVNWGPHVAASMYAIEVAPNSNSFQVYSAPKQACPTVTALTVPDGPIGQGSSDTAGVTQIQIFLNTFQAPSDLLADGLFGNQTAMRLGAWQTAQGLAVDRIWHPDDAAKARQLIASGAPTATWTPIGGPVAGPIEFTTDNGGFNDARMTTGAATSALGVCDLNGRVTHYRGSIRVEGGASKRVMNRVRIEDYLRGVVPKEISASWADAGGGAGLQSVKAQAVAARSYALQPGRWANGICDTQSCQVYFGAASRPSVASLAVPVEDSRSDRAITETVGKVRRWTVDVAGAGKTGDIVSTEFSGSNGPRTAGWPFSAVDDALGDGTSLNRNHRWTRVLDANALAAKYALGTLTSVTMTEGSGTDGTRYDGIWYNNVVLSGTGGSKTIPAWTFRNDNGLPSPGFTLRTETSAGRPMGVNQRIELQVVGTRVTAPDGTTDVVPTGVSAVAINITAVLPSAAGFMTVWPCDVGRPDASNLNFVANGVVANSVIAPVGATGKVCFYTNQTSHLLVDIAGWFSGSSFVGATPKRVLDTRNAIGGPKVRIPAGGTIAVPLAGAAMQRPNGASATIPSDATAVAMNVTAVLPSRAGFFTVWPCGSAMPTTSNVNFTTGSVVANGVVASLGAGGAVCIYSDQQSDVLVDVLGWFGAGTGQPPYTGAIPSRLVDTRNAIGGPTGVVTPGAPKAVAVRGVSVNVNGTPRQVPTDASAVALNVTMVEAQEAGYATVWPCGTPMPDASNVNFASGGTAANGVIAPIGADGSVCVFTSENAHLIVDIAGWFTGGGTPAFEGNIPKRLVDTRNNIGPAPVG